MKTSQRITSAWEHLGRVGPDLFDSERVTYEDAIVCAEAALFHGEHVEASAQMDRLRDWVNVWVIPRLRGDEPEACDPFLTGLPNRWERKRPTTIAVPNGLMPDADA